MAWTSVGFDGTITEIQWAGLAGLLGNGYVAAGNGDCLVTAVGGARSVSVAAGSLYGDGVLSINSGAETVAMTTPVNGQWYVIALRRTWATNTAALVAIAGATTTTTTPTAAPTSFPTLNTNVGVLTDQPIAWAWCNSANTTVVVYDLRMSPYKQTNPVSVASVNDRDAKFSAPVQGTEVWRNDLGALETYYGLYNVSTNPGGRSAAGWYQEPAGRVIQVVQTQNNSSSTTTSSSYQNTSTTCSITPKSLNSKIVVEFSAAAMGINTTEGVAYATVYRGNNTGTNIAASYSGGAMAYIYKNSGFNLDVPTSGIAVDYPNTLSSQTYTICIKTNGIGTAGIGGLQTLKLTEVAV